MAFFEEGESTPSPLDLSHKIKTSPLAKTNGKCFTMIIKKIHLVNIGSQYF